MKNAVLALALAALGGFFLLMSSMARPVQGAACVLVVGYSNTMQWYSDGGFESKQGIVNSEWESIAEGGSHIARLAYESAWNWDRWAVNDIASDCTSNPRTPTVVLLDVGFRYQADIDNGVQILQDAVARTRSELGFSGTIYLKPMVGTHESGCTNWSIVAAPQSVTKVNAVVASDPTLRAAPYITIPCSQFKDGDTGHFTSSGSSNVASQVAAWWASLGSVPTATPTPTQVPPTPTSTPVPTLVSCERVATYSDGSKVTTALPLGDC